jgi:hypothetical protein
MSTSYIIDRIHRYDKIKDIIANSKQEISPIDPFLGKLGDLGKHSLLHTTTEAHAYLFSNKIIKELCCGIKTNKLPILIGGSVAMRAMYNSKVDIIPADIDLYMKRINYCKVETLNTIIRSMFDPLDYYIIIIRSPITLNWLICNKKSNMLIQQIQLNLMNIQTSWAEYFITCHSSIVCAGYDIVENKFVYLENAWEDIIEEDKTQYFTNLLNCDSKTSLLKAIDKYNQRGFKCAAVHLDTIDPTKANNNQALDNISDDGADINNNQPIIQHHQQSHWVSEPAISSDEDDLDDDLIDDLGYIPSYHQVNNMPQVMSHSEYNANIVPSNNPNQYVQQNKPAIVVGLNGFKNIISHLKSKYAKVDNIAYGSNISHLYGPKDIIHPNMIDLWEIRDNYIKHKKFIDIPSNIIIPCSNPSNCSCDNLCPIEQEHNELFVANILCPHKISLRMFIYNPLKLCPLCREVFKPNPQIVYK